MEFSVADSKQTEDLVRVCGDSFSDSEGAESGAVIRTLVRALLQDLDSKRATAFTASQADIVVGAIVFSELLFSDAAPGLLLSPVAVITKDQSTGVGQGLIRYGLQALTEMGHDVVFTYGNPAYYSRFGFLPISESQVAAPYPLSQPHGWQALSLAGNELAGLQGTVSCVEAFADPGLW